MTITYIRHSGFIIEDDSCALMIDCCGLKPNCPEINSLANKPLYILASHVHGDHFDSAVMDITGTNRKWILSADITDRVKHNDNEIHFLRKGGVFKDALVTIRAYGSTDEGISFYIEAGGKKLFHAGDLNNWHWNEEETPADAAKNEKFFLEELALIVKDIPVLDAAMFPVDPRLGKDYTRGAEQFLEKIKTGLFIPMHFWDDYKAANKSSVVRQGCRFAEIKQRGDEFII